MYEPACDQDGNTDIVDKNDGGEDIGGSQESMAVERVVRRI